MRKIILFYFNSNKFKWMLCICKKSSTDLVFALFCFTIFLGCGWILNTIKWQLHWQPAFGSFDQSLEKDLPSPGWPAGTLLVRGKRWHLSRRYNKRSTWGFYSSCRRRVLIYCVNVNMYFRTFTGAVDIYETLWDQTIKCYSLRNVASLSFRCLTSALLMLSF